MKPTTIGFNICVSFCGGGLPGRSELIWFRLLKIVNCYWISSSVFSQGFFDNVHTIYCQPSPTFFSASCPHSRCPIILTHTCEQTKDPCCGSSTRSALTWCTSFKNQDTLPYCCGVCGLFLWAECHDTKRCWFLAFGQSLWRQESGDDCQEAFRRSRCWPALPPSLPFCHTVGPPGQTDGDPIWLINVIATVSSSISPLPWARPHRREPTEQE